MRMRINRKEILKTDKELIYNDAVPGDIFYFKDDECKITYMVLKNKELGYVDLQTGEVSFPDEKEAKTPIYIYPAPELRLTEFIGYSSME